jgi:hypothetical protein
MQTDHYLAYIPRSTSSLNWLPFSFGGKSLERAIGQRLDGLLSRSLTFDAPALSAEEGLAGQQTQTFRCDGAGVKVVFQAKEIAGELYRVKPAVFQTRNEICIFHGYLSNLEDLIDLLAKSGRTRGFGVPAVGAAQDGALAAELLLHMYHSTRASDLLIMLSELQGVYSFCIYDSQKRSVFAARDPSGREPLFYAVDEDEAISFTNKPFNVPGGERLEDWAEVPPGHFIAGKNARLQQFALTPEQLYQREVYESMEDEGSPPPASPLTPGRLPENSSLSSVQSNFDVDALFRISM